MTMRITRLGDAERFSPVGHAGVGPVRLQGGASTPTTDFSVALSHYLPGGGAELSPQVAETVYVVVSGALVMISEGEEATLGRYDSPPCS
jgi:mannose-6-phosphate isomerase-like protein (cupin superfamily)